MGKTKKKDHFFQGSEKVVRQGICRHQDSRGAPIKILKQHMGLFSKQKLLTLSVFILNTKIEFYFFYPKSWKATGQDPITPHIPYFGLVVLPVEGIPWCVNHNGLDNKCRKHLWKYLIWQIQSHHVVYYYPKNQSQSFLNLIYYHMKTLGVILS